MTTDLLVSVPCNASHRNCTMAGPTSLVPSYPDYTGWIQFSITAQFVLIFVIFFGNATVLLLVACRERLRTVSNSFVVSLAVSDVFLSVAMIPGIDITLNPARAGEKYTCLLFWCSIMFISSASVYSLLALSLERYLKIVYPLHHYMTAAKAGIILASVWAYTFTISFLLPFAGLNDITDQPFVCFDIKDVFDSVYFQIYCYMNGILPFLVMFVMYRKIFAVVLEKLRAESDQQPSGSGAANAGAHSQQWLRREFKAIKNLTMVLGFTMIGWVPVICMILRQLYEPTYNPSFQTRVILSTLTYINSAVNPLLYSLRTQAFREALEEIFCRIRGRNAVHAV